MPFDFGIKSEADKRVISLKLEAISAFVGDKANVDAFLSRKYRDAGYETPIQMARRSEVGLHTARCLLRPTGGC